MSTILITGGAGYIGSHTCLTLLNQGNNLVVLDSLINSSEESLKRINTLKKTDKKLFFFKGDIRNCKLLNHIFQKQISSGFPITSVIHFAGLKSVQESTNDPIKYWDFNVNGSLSLFRAMVSFNCENIIFSSSATVYRPKNTLIDENSEIKPSNPYGNSKLAVEKILEDLFIAKDKKLKIACLRYFNPIGAHESGDIGEDPFGIPDNVFPSISQVAVGRRKFLKIFGSDWPTLDGTGVRDYIHVMDLAEGHAKTLDYLLNSESQFLKLNLGTGRGTSVLELVDKFSSVNKCTIPYQIVSRREGDVAQIIADNSYAKKLLNWEPQRKIEEMCLSGWLWQTKNPNGYCNNF